MARQIVLIVEAEQEGFSARKLIIESLKHNVLTAYSSEEALDLLSRVQVDIVIVHSGLRGEPCSKLLSQIQNLYPEITVLALSPGADEICGEVNTLDSLRPEQLVSFFQQAVEQTT